jgi:hypothetical protein
VTGANKFLSPDVLRIGAREVVHYAQREGVRVALAGGYALQLYGSDRLTGDLDFLVSSTDLGLPFVERLPKSGGVRVLTTCGVLVDLIVRTDDYAELYSTALASAILINDDIPVVPVEFIAAILLAARHRKYRVDLEWLVANRLDIPHARMVIKTFLGAYAAEDFDSVVSEVEWKKSRGML